MRYFLDTEFIEDGVTITLVSIALVCEDGRELYCEVDRVDWSRASPWVLENVKPKLWHLQPDKSPFNRWSRDGGVGGLMEREEIKRTILRFCAPELHGPPEVWAYFADYDWVALCQLFGTMQDLPNGWPMFCMDLKQWAVQLGNPALPETGDGEHGALDDARWNSRAWALLNEEWVRMVRASQ